MNIAYTPLNEKALFDLEMDVFAHLCRDIRSVRASLYWQQIKLDPRNYLQQDLPAFVGDVATFTGDYLLQQVLRKNPRLPTKIDRAAVATQKFLESERRNEVTNRRFATVDPSHELVVKAQASLEYILGELCRTDLEFVFQRLKFGKGSDTQGTYDTAYPEEKFREYWACSPRLAALAQALPFETGESDYVQTLQTVPKDSKGDRCILKQCRGNLALQRATGQLLRERLNRRTNLKLNDQRRNQGLCRTAWEQGLATLDLSSASDSIALRVISTLFSTDTLRPWLHLLQLGRLDTMYEPGSNSKIRTLEMWSAMGNGYTWELESLLFYAITRAVTGAGCEKQVGVYGDDIIVPGRYYSSLVEALDFFGFRVNEGKSFWQSDFRESCGTDFIQGKACRPFYLQSDHSDTRPRASYVLQMINQINEYTGRTGRELRGTLDFLHTLLERWGFDTTAFMAPAKAGDELGQLLVFPHQLPELAWVLRRICYVAGRPGIRAKCLTKTLPPVPQLDELWLRRSLYDAYLHGLSGDDVPHKGNFVTPQDRTTYLKHVEKRLQVPLAHERPNRDNHELWTTKRTHHEV